MTVTVKITKEVQEAMDIIMNGGYECAEWCYVSRYNECLGKFEGDNWIVDAEEEIAFLQEFINVIVEQNKECDVTDYDDMTEFTDDVANMHAASLLLWKISNLVLEAMEADA